MAMNKFAAAATGLAAVGLLAGGATLAQADATAQPSTKPSASASTGSDQAQQDRQHRSQDTAVTGDQKQKVIDAVTAEHEGVTITEVREDPDGSFDALGTDSDGNRVFYEVSSDLKTVSERAGRGGPEGRPAGGQAGGQGHHGRHGGPGGCDNGASGEQQPQAPSGAASGTPQPSSTPTTQTGTTEG